MANLRQTKRSFLRQQGTLNPRPDQVRDESFRDSEFFDPEDLLQVKYEMLRQVDVDKQPVSQAAKSFGFSRPSFYQAQTAFQQFVTQLRVAEPGISSPQLADRIAQRFGISVHPRSIDRQLRHQKKL